MQQDFSKISTNAAAKKLAAAGRLVAIHLFPRELGGQDDPENIAYITPAAAKEREEAIGQLIKHVKKGDVNQMDVLPDYRGDSIVPTRIVMKAWHSGNGTTSERVIAIW